MIVTVIFPKASCYDSKDADTKRIYNMTFKKYIDMLIDCGCTVEYFLEDKLANDFLSGYDNKRVISAVSQNDFTLLKGNKSLVQFEDYFYDDYSSVENVSGFVDKKYQVPMSLLREDKDLYLVKRMDMHKKKLRVAMDDYLSKRQGVLMFRHGGGLDRCTSVKDTAQQGDGRLCIEVGLGANMAVCYYGGTYIQEDYLSTILSI